MLDIITRINGNTSGPILAALEKSLALIEFTPDGTILRANQNFLTAMGYSADEIVGQHHRMFVSDQERDSDAYASHWSGLAAGEAKVGRFERRTKTGEVIWIEGAYAPVLSRSGTVEKIVKIVSDVTMQVLAEQQTASLFTAIDASQARIEFSPDGAICEANDLFLAATGYSREELVGQHHRLFMPPGEAETADYAQFWSELGAGQAKQGSFKRVTKTGDDLWLAASYTPVLGLDGEVLRVVKFARDITEQRRQEAATRSVVDSIERSQAVIEFTLGGIIERANDNFLSAMGYELNEIVGQHHSIFVAPDYAQSQDYRDFWARLASGESVSGEFHRLNKSGSDVYINASYNPVLGPDGVPVRVIKFATDITESVRRRQVIEEAGDSVADQLGAMLQDIATVNDRTNTAADQSRQTTEIVQSVASAMQEYSASSREIAQSVMNTRSAVERASTEVSSVGEATQTLSKNAAQMTDVVTLIQDIAEQINLLALNATIEAARAGDAGKGFAVVASEVKNLADQVARATTQISGEIENMQTVSSTVVENLGLISREVELVESSVVGVAGAVEEQEVTTQDIVKNMSMAADAVNGINDNITEIVCLARSSATAAQTAEGSVARLRRA